MEILRSVTQTVLGSPQAGNKPTGAETVERLLDRVQSSSLLEDRRDGCRALKALSKKYRLLIGAHGMDTLIQVLESDRNDHEIVNYALETLVNITSDEVFVEEAEEENEVSRAAQLESAKIGEQFSEIFAKRVENVALVLSLLDEFDFKVRFAAMKLLNNLLHNRPKELQEVILVTPSAVSKLMDMLSDSREVIRNDTLLLLCHLTKGNTNLQKIVVFENAFDLLFDIVKGEGAAEGGVVVEDCLALMRTLLGNNPSNQTLFKEGSYIQKMVDFFDLPLESDVGWSAQKVANVHYMLKLVRTLVSPQNSAQLVAACQAKMSAGGGLLARLCALLMAVGVPADILSDTIVTVAELIRGCRDNQEYFAGVTAPSNPPRAAIVVLLMSMVNEKQPFGLRCGVLYCFQCFLYRNPDSQAQVVQTLLPQTAQANQITAGQLLCGGLFSADSLSNWFSAVALSHALLDNTTQKEQLLRVQLATGVGSPPVSLLQQCATLLQGGSKILTRLGILQLLCTWLAHCPIAVTHLLALPGVIPHLTAYLSASEHDETEVVCQGVVAFLVGLCAFFNDGSVASFTRDALAHLVANRVGRETFADRLESLLRAEAYARAAKAPLLTARAPIDVVFDHEFTKLFKALEASVLRSLLPQEKGGQAEEAPPEEVTRYKDIIREQDAELTRLRQALAERQCQMEALKVAQKEEPKTDTPMTAEATLTSTMNTTPPQKQQGPSHNQMAHLQQQGPSHDQMAHLQQQQAPSNEQVVLLQQQLTEMTYARDYYYYQMVEKDTLLQGQVRDGSASSSASVENPQMENLRKQLEDLQLALYRKDEEIQRLQDNPPVPPPPTCSHSDGTELSAKLGEEKASLESSLKRLQDDKGDLEARLVECEAMMKDKDDQIERLSSSTDTNRKCQALEAEMSRMQGEQEDLLVLLTDQETKISEMKRSLKKYGETFSDDDDDEDDDEDDDGIGPAHFDLDVSSDDDEDDELS